MASPFPEGTKRLVRYSSHPAQVRLDRAYYYHHRQRKEIRAIDNLQAQWAEHVDAEEAKEKAGKQEAPRPPLRRVTQRLTVKNENTAALLAKYLDFVNHNYSDHPAVANDNYSDSPATANDDCPDHPALVNNDCSDRSSFSDRSCYSEYSDRPALDNEFGVACVLDYHAFLFERYELFSCKNPICQLHMRRLQELNSRLKEDLERPRVKVAEASMSLINYCNQTRDYMVPSVWGQVDRKEDPYNPQSGGSEGCCIVM